MTRSDNPSKAEAPPVQGIDHVHLFVTDRVRALTWYGRALGLSPVSHLEGWAADGGPLTLADRAGRVHIAVFERPHQPCRSTIALRVDGEAFLQWLVHLRAALEELPDPVDHGLSWSVYFRDPDGNPFEITTYDVTTVKGALT
jgi:catechol 2,3-dioxygenase-like lactoylglutathione lyase family enzyme